MANNYFSRRLSFTCNGQVFKVDEDTFLKIPGPKIVLGEPGMGKSSLIAEIGRRIDVKIISAANVLQQDIRRYLNTSKPLLIDGLDEAMARREGDAVDRILEKLDSAGCPDFILSCRVREWETRTEIDLSQLYSSKPIIFTLEAFDQKDAIAFLSACFPGIDSVKVLQHLDAHGISNLYGSPLMLKLMGKVAQSDTNLPPTRATLFERICELLWPEYDPHRPRKGLVKITNDEALSASGAMMAALLLGGGEAISQAGYLQLQVGDIKLEELAALPDADAAFEIFSSKLFSSIDPYRAKPIHRVIAEFLGARWLAQQAKTPRIQRSLLRQLQSGGAIPASLRGLHAWLAYHSPEMALQVIEADPFGVLSHCETNALNSKQAECMFNSLQALAELDPYFRSNDWQHHSIVGLMKPNLFNQIEAFIASPQSNTNLRMLLIGGMKDAQLTESLAVTLENIMFCKERFFAERSDAAIALLRRRDHIWWRGAIQKFHDEGTDDSTRLAREMIPEIHCEICDELLVAILLAEMGFTICPIPRIPRDGCISYKNYARIVAMLAPQRIINVMNLLCQHARLVVSDEWRGPFDFIELFCSLFLRAIDEKLLKVENASLAWDWLGALALLRIERVNRGFLESLSERLDVEATLRNAIQRHALYNVRPRPTIWEAEIDLKRRMVGLAGRNSDIVVLLENMEGLNNKDQVLRKEWCDLILLGMDGAVLDPAVRAASRKFQAGDKELEAFIKRLENPKMPRWQRRQIRENEKNERKNLVEREVTRRFYRTNKLRLREGDLGVIYRPATTYLDLYRNLQGDKTPEEEIVESLGSDLASDVMIGLEAVLHRTDLPAFAEVASKLAQDLIYESYFVIVAALIARLRAGLSCCDIPIEVQKLGLLLLYDINFAYNKKIDRLGHVATLEQAVFATEESRMQFARQWLEPKLSAGSKNTSGFDQLAREKSWHMVGVILATEWLESLPDLSDEIEWQLVNCLCKANAFEALKSIAAARSQIDFTSKERLFTWRAIDALVRFDEIMPTISDIAEKHPEFIWFLRNRFEIDYRSSIHAISVKQASWVVSAFRTQLPYAELNGASAGRENPYDATDFIRVMINHIANDTGAEAVDAMQSLVAATPDGYSNLIRHMAAGQRQKIAEQTFCPLSPPNLGALLRNAPPINAEDLKSHILEELMVIQNMLIGDDVDSIRLFWSDNGTIPYEENRCRDSLTLLIEPLLKYYKIQRITEADMPNHKRVDLAFAYGALQLPMEMKGQWHEDVWSAATDQLARHYLNDCRAEGRGIYCVLWFGELPSSSGRRLKPPPEGNKRPKTPEEMRGILIKLMPEKLRGLIDIVVLDCSEKSQRRS